MVEPVSSSDRTQSSGIRSLKKPSDVLFTELAQKALSETAEALTTAHHPLKSAKKQTIDSLLSESVKLSRKSDKLADALIDDLTSDISPDEMAQSLQVSLQTLNESCVTTFLKISKGAIPSPPPIEQYCREIAEITFARFLGTITTAVLRHYSQQGNLSIIQDLLLDTKNLLSALASTNTIVSEAASFVYSETARHLQSEIQKIQSDLTPKIEPEPLSQKISRVGRITIKVCSTLGLFTVAGQVMWRKYQGESLPSESAIASTMLGSLFFTLLGPVGGAMGATLPYSIGKDPAQALFEDLIPKAVSNLVWDEGKRLVSKLSFLDPLYEELLSMASIESFRKALTPQHTISSLLSPMEPVKRIVGTALSCILR